MHPCQGVSTCQCSGVMLSWSCFRVQAWRAGQQQTGTHTLCTMSEAIPTMQQHISQDSTASVLLPARACCCDGCASTAQPRATGRKLSAAVKGWGLNPKPCSWCCADAGRTPRRTTRHLCCRCCRSTQRYVAPAGKPSCCGFCCSLSGQGAQCVHNAYTNQRTYGMQHR